MSDQFRALRSIVLHIAVFIAVFVVAVLASSRLINKSVPDVASAMADSTFPLVSMQRDGIEFNCMHGYCREMDPDQVRYSITPLSGDRSITLCIRTFGAAIDSVSYEVVTIDGTQSLENTRVIRMSEDGDVITAPLTLGDTMRMNQEYVMKVQVTTGGRNIYYYTHVLLADGLHTADYLNFAAGFWDKCINKTDLDTVGAAVEPDESTDADNTLAYMDIHDSVNQLTWAELGAQIYYKPTPRLTEINESTATLALDYRISATGDAGNTEVYDVHEYYRLRFTDSRVFLLNFERTTDQVFNPDSAELLSEDGILLGITQKDVNYMADERMRCVAFVQENELWTYRKSDRLFTRVFGFPQQTGMDGRDFYDENTIRILRVTSGGDVTFAVGGYMNRGAHEGDNGICVYYYDAGSTMVSELGFVRSNENTERLQRDMESCLYLTQDSRTLWALMEGALYRVSLADDSVESVTNEVRNECYAGSRSGRCFAWLKEGLVYGSQVIEEIDFETGRTREITAGAEEYVRPLTYMKEDLVYGIARGSDISVPHGGCGVFPMYKLEFSDRDGNVVKTYEPSGLYVTAADQTDNLLNLRRVAWDGSRFVEATPDQIVSTDTTEDVTLGIATKEEKRRQTVVLLRVGSVTGSGSANTATSKIVAGLTTHLIAAPVNPDPERLYAVYAAGGLDALCTYPNDAIVQADELFGVVIDYEQNYVWVRGDKETEAQMDLSLVPAVMQSGTVDTAAMESGLGRKVVDLSGCTLDEVLYFVSHNRPVLADTKEGVKIIVGYDEYNTHLLTPGEDEWTYYGIQDSTDLFALSGNVFYSYTDAPAAG